MLIFEAERFFLGDSVSESNLIAEDEIHVVGNVLNMVAEIGNAEALGGEMDTLREVIRAGRGKKAELLQQIQKKRQQLDKLLQATGITFNLNIGQIIKHMDRGLVINLASFYNALQGRTENEIDQALREFFAKAVLGVLQPKPRFWGYLAENVANCVPFFACLTMA